MQQERYGEIMLDPDAIFKDVEIKLGRGKSALNMGLFKIRALQIDDRLKIGQARALMAKGLPADSYSVEDQEYMRRTALVNVGVEEGPDWFEDAGSCRTDEMLIALSDEIEKWTADYASELKKNRPAAAGKRSSAGRVSSPAPGNDAAVAPE